VNERDMKAVEFVLSRNRRDDIMKAVKAIEREMKEMTGKPDWQALWVIGTNLSIIQMNLANLRRADSE
jgi:hypothetical protein